LGIGVLIVLSTALIAMRPVFGSHLDEAPDFGLANFIDGMVHAIDEARKRSNWSSRPIVKPEDR
jgi:hypothetical protein